MATEVKKKKEKIAKYEGPEYKKKLPIKRHFTTPFSEKYIIDPYKSVDWEIRDAIAGDFEQKGVEAPVCWSDSAVGIVAKLYFATSNGKRENSVNTLIKRVVKKITDEGIKHKYFDEVDACIFEAELAYILINQIAAFNTPVWLNLGVPGRKQCCSACYLLNVEDTIFGEDSITDWWNNEAAIFKSGAGSGANLSKIRGSMEPISIGGIASGPVSFMRVADANAGTIKSGSVARRAAKLVCLDVDHPDILDFIDSKVREDERMRTLMAAGVNLDPSTPEGEKNIAECTSFQNANISVRLSDKFMESVENDNNWELFDRVSGEVREIRPARNILSKIAYAAWQCADPGVMFDDTINKWHTTPSLGKINTANPCIEVQQNDNTSCNLASINLVKFLNKDNSFRIDDFNHTVDIMITAMDITCSFSELPTKKIEENTRNLRQLGLGYSNLGAALMIQGMPYDSDEGRDWAASVTSLMTARAYRRSGELAKYLGSFTHYKYNEKYMDKIIDDHILYNNYDRITKDIIWRAAGKNWSEAYDFDDGFRNSQVTVIAPTGTISFMMDCDTTGAEPAYSLVTHKKLASGGNMEMKLKCYDDAINKFSGEEFKQEIFQTAVGNNSISPMGHIKMLAAIQPHISGAISKTVNLPESATVEDIYNLYLEAWKMGIKCLAVYRDGSKATQVLSIKSDSSVQNSPDGKSEENVLQDMPLDISYIDHVKEGERLAERDIIESSNREILSIENISKSNSSRRRLNDDRVSLTHKFSIGEHEGYITAGMYEDGTLGEIFLSGLGKEGSTLKGVLEGWAIAISMGLQHGVPLESFARKFSSMSFEPRGLTSNKEIRNAHSILDYVMRWLISKFGDHDLHQEFGVMSDKVKEINESKYNFSSPDIKVDITTPLVGGLKPSGKLCSCGAIMNQTGTCYSCPSCGITNGCG